MYRYNKLHKMEGIMGKSKTQNTHITQNVKHKEYIENLKNIYDLIIYTTHFFINELEIMC